MFDDLEKVKQGLSCHAHIAHLCPECPYNEQRKLYMKGTGSPCDSFLADDALKLMEKAKPRLLTMEEAQKLEAGTVVWLEQSGGYEGSRYRAEPVILYMNSVETAHFYGSSGRAYSGYNLQYCGWRLWTAEPSDEMRLGTKWIV